MFKWLFGNKSNNDVFVSKLNRTDNEIAQDLFLDLKVRKHYYKNNLIEKSNVIEDFNLCECLLIGRNASFEHNNFKFDEEFDKVFERAKNQPENSNGYYNKSNLQCLIASSKLSEKDRDFYKSALWGKDENFFLYDIPESAVITMMFPCGIDSELILARVSTGNEEKVCGSVYAFNIKINDFLKNQKRDAILNRIVYDNQTEFMYFK